MGCPPYTASDLKKLQIVFEENFGITPEIDLIYGGDFKSVSGGSTDMNATQQRYGGTKLYNEMIYEAPTYGWTGSLVFKRSSDGRPDWADIWGILALGSLTEGPQRNLPFFSALIQGAPKVYQLCNGCVVNSLQISSSGLGKEIAFDVDVLCKYISRSTTKKFEGLQNVTLGNDATDYGTEILHTLSFPEYFRDGDDPSSLKCKSWSLSIENNVFGSEDVIAGADGEKYILANGLCIASDTVSINFNATLIASTEKWTEMKFQKVTDMNINIPIGSRIIKLTGGGFLGNDFPTRTQGQYDDSISIAFRGIEIE